MSGATTDDTALRTLPFSERWLYLEGTGSPRNPLAAFLCAATSLGWRGAARLNRALPRRRFVAPWPVVSVGALAVGGAGKTPMALWCARALVAQGAQRVLVALRGYGRRSRAVLVADAPHAAPVEALGDEASMLLDEIWRDPRLRGRVLVGVGARRAEVIRAAGEVAGRFDATVLDDGLQHHAVARAIDLVLLDPACERQRMLPAGPLREPPSALPLEALLQVHCGDGGHAPLPLEIAGREIALASRYRLASLEEATTGEAWSVEALSGARVALVTAVARNAQVRALLARAGVSAEAHLALGDHGWFRAGAVETLARDHDVLVTTAKDWPRLRRLSPRCPVLVARVEVAFERGEAELRARLAGLVS